MPFVTSAKSPTSIDAAFDVITSGEHTGSTHAGLAAGTRAAGAPAAVITAFESSTIGDAKALSRKTLPVLSTGATCLLFLWSPPCCLDLRLARLAGAPWFLRSIRHAGVIDEAETTLEGRGAFPLGALIVRAVFPIVTAATRPAAAVVAALFAVTVGEADALPFGAFVEVPSRAWGSIREREPGTL